MRHVLDEPGQLRELDYDDLLTSDSTIRNYFYTIWNNIIQKTQLNISIDTAIEEVKDLVIYEALDGSRSTIISGQSDIRGIEGALFAVNFIHVLRAMGAKTCLIMVHTSYNRARGEDEFKNILSSVKTGAPFIKKYAMENNIHCSCICMNEKHECINLLKDVTESTKNGEFCAHFLFDYNEECVNDEKWRNIIENLPDINVHIRHTKFQFSGGWIPGKMARSVFLYSQNGTTYSHWETDELVSMVVLALLAKLLHKDEMLDKIYTTTDEISERYELRELKLFNKVIQLRNNPKKLFIIGSPIGVYQFYY